MVFMIRKAQPTPGDVHVDGPLTNISIAYLQRAEAFVADRVFPNISVLKQSDLYFEYDRGMFNRDQMAKRAPGTETQGVGYTVSSDSNYFCDVWGLHHDIPDQRRANADSPLQPDREATELLTHQAMIRREAAWVDGHFVTGKWGTNESTPSPLWDAASSTPVEDVETAKQAIGASTGFEPNVLVLARPVWGILKNHPDIVDRIKYGQTGPGPAIASQEAVAAVLGVDRILVSRAIENTAAEGVVNVHAYMAADNALLAYAAPSPGLMTPSAGYTFSWSGYAGAGGAGQRISRFRMDALRADRVEIEMAFVQKQVAADLGYLFLQVIT